ncbi:hypothetical protein PPERSA_06956 [Pseudocohnilembus persalinus]|uniref:Vesicle transport protein n=1 Tax=Pseudocohnilembus persalinus TaxID=266149 RepID=A0A0V0QZ52_PSEPJ|nr:hypothetical protein PPERSA_06956 [Pseudocohnilembus persalinus]|eukprot:KRX07341.1 hypothetical protein PPERSA_06956 [Pseudocohnilembus persalinus]
MSSYFADILPFSKSQDEQTTVLNSNQSFFPSMTYKERLIGFLICVGLGWFIELMSFGAVFALMTGKPEKFAISYTLGNILSLFGTGFLIGFEKQIKNMKNKERLITSIIFFTSMVMTLLSALVFKIPILVLVFIIIQFCSYVWYVASYIPFARGCIKSSLKKVFRTVSRSKSLQ